VTNGAFWERLRGTRSRLRFSTNPEDSGPEIRAWDALKFA